jgi:HK97 family phage major capsid protein
MAAAGTGVTGGTAQSGEATSDEVIDLFYSVIDPYARNGFWFMQRATEGKIRKLKDSNNQYLWQAGLQVGSPNQLLGRPIVTDPNVAATGTSALSIAFGDFSAYYIRDVAGVRFERSDHFAFSSDMVTYRAILRTDGDLVDLSGAIKAYAGGTA